MELRLLTPPNDPPPLPHWLLKALGPRFATARKEGAIPWSAQVLRQGARGINLFFPPPRIATYSHVDFPEVNPVFDSPEGGGT